MNVIKEDPKKENIIYVGSDNGLYASFDMGKSFMTVGNLPRVPVHDIAIQQRDNDIVIGTHGRSIYITRLDAVQKAWDSLYNRSGIQKEKAVIPTRRTKENNEVEASESNEAGEAKKD